jgi:hypothetical protein
MRVHVLKKSYGVKYFEKKNASLYCLISDFRREVTENCAFRRYYAAISGNSLPTFRDNLSVPSSMTKNPNRKVVPKRQ